MSSSKIGSSFSPALAATVRPTVERPLASRPEPRAVGLPSRDEFVPGGSPRSNSNTLIAPEAPSASSALLAPEAPSDASTLPASLEPFRGALEDLAKKVATEQPELLDDDEKLSAFLADSFRQMGLPEEEWGTATRFVGDVARGINTGKEKYA